MKTSKPLKIIIADDDTDDLQYLNFLFKNHKGFEIIGCLTSGKSVLDTIEHSGNVPDVLLVDMHMPIMTGSEVANILLDDSTFSNMAIFIISGVINRTEEERLKGRVHFLEKPTTLVQITDLPEVILEKMKVGNVNWI
ncbi:response regulator [Flavobacterium sp. PLA-1-15]|uniref:response regulator n=1 Tax=Flavobacterium sp. PLA-1-15 TaxID=3380533 RepID=UPI003B7B4AC7